MKLNCSVVRTERIADVKFVYYIVLIGSSTKT